MGGENAMNKLSLMAMIAGLVLLAGCAARQPMTRSEWLEMTTCEFEGKTVDEVLLAAEKVLRLSDSPSDVHLYHTPSKIVAARHYNYYAVLVASFGQFNFDISATQDGNITKMHLMIGLTDQAITPSLAYVPGSGGGTMGVTASSGPVNIGIPINFKEVYQLFFLRMKAILYGDPWYSCGEAAALLLPEKWEESKKQARMDMTESGAHEIAEEDRIAFPFQLEALCFQADDRQPN